MVATLLQGVGLWAACTFIGAPLAFLLLVIAVGAIVARVQHRPVGPAVRMLAGEAWQALRSGFWVLTHPRLFFRFSAQLVLAGDAHVLHRAGWAPADVKAVRSAAEIPDLAKSPDSPPVARAVTRSRVAHVLGRHVALAARVLPPAAMHAWLPVLDCVLLGAARSDLRAAYEPLEDRPTAGEVLRFAGLLADWHAAAGPLLPRALRAGLTVEETSAFRAQGELTEATLQTLIALRRDPNLSSEEALRIVLDHLYWLNQR